MLKFRMKRVFGNVRKLYFVQIGQAPTMGRGGYTKDYAKDICKKLKEGNYVLTTTDVNIQKAAQDLKNFEGNPILQPYECHRTSHSVLLVMGGTLLKSKRLTQEARKEIEPTDLVVIDSNAGSFFQSLGGENIASLKEVDGFREFGDHDNYVTMVKDIHSRLPSPYCLKLEESDNVVGIKVFGHNFMVDEYNELFNEVKDTKDGVCGVFTEIVARWFQDPSYLPDIGSIEPRRRVIVKRRKTDSSDLSDLSDIFDGSGFDL